MAEWIVGTMSGTSMDGVDVALVLTDGETKAEPGATLSKPYGKADRDLIASAMAAYAVGDHDNSAILEAERLVTERHAEAIHQLLEEADVSASDVSLIGFHGQTIFHAPHQGTTVQLGDGADLAKRLNIDVAYDFRSADVVAGGEGAPLVPIFHEMLLRDVEKPAAILNVGGVANVTVARNDGLVAFDTGPGNALIDDWIRARTSRKYDEWGRIAAQGNVLEDVVAQWLSHPYFERAAPKSLDRNSFDVNAIDRASIADGAATLTAFSAQSIARGIAGYELKALYVAGGGAHNRTMISMLEKASSLTTQPVDRLGFDGDFLEAQAFAYLAARVRKGLPLTFPSTTGVTEPTIGGRMANA